MTTILVDHDDIEGPIMRLWGTLAAEGWLTLIPLQMSTFAHVGLPVDSSDRTIWRFAQTQKDGQMDNYLRSTEIIDWEHPQVLALALDLAAGSTNLIEIARRCFEWVHDEIRHSHDYRMNPVTCTASEVLAAGTGYCYAKSHLLAALLRANSIPAGLCYQRLSRDDNGAPYCLHGLNAVYLPNIGWYRIDPRGNKEGVNAQFTPPVEQLAFVIRYEGEGDLPEVWPDPLPVVISVLRTYRTYDALWENLPDVPILSSRAVG